MFKSQLLGPIMALGFCLCACGFFQPQTKVVEVTRVVQSTAVATSASSGRFMLEVIQGISLEPPRTLHTATRLNDGRILLVGGSNGMDEHYATAEIFDPAGGTLTPAAHLHTPRHDHSATLLQDNRVLIVGGYNYRQQWLADAEIYDPAKDTWEIVPPIYSHGVQHTATLLLDGRVLVVGGCIGSGICTERVEIFDPGTNSWSKAMPLRAYRASHAAALLDDGRVLVAGGGGPNGTPNDGDGLLYDPDANTWTATGPMVWQGAQAQMLKMQDGRVLAVGGLSVSAYPVASAGTEIYDPGDNTWMPAASLSQPRYAFNLVLLPDGRAMAVGGAREYDYPYNYPDSHPWRASSFVREIEIYDPSSNLWQIAGELPQPVTYAAAVFLPDGRLWVTGGGAGHAIATAWAETWLLAPIPLVWAAPTSSPQRSDERIAMMQKEITFRLQEIHTFLDHEPMTKGVLYNATARIQAHGVGISYEFKDWELRTLLFELEQVTPAEKQSDVQDIRRWFEELEQLGPQAPFSEAEPADPQSVQSARILFEQIEVEWERFLEYSK